MISTESIDRVIGSNVYDSDGDKIGTASEVFLDDQSGQPEWVTVKTGLFGTKESFVPLRDADLTDNGVRVPVTKAAVKDAPKIDTEGHLSPEEEQDLYRYYGFEGNTTSNTMTNTTTDTSNTRDSDLTVGDAARVGAAGTSAGTAGVESHDMRGTDTRDTDMRDTDMRGTESRGAVGHDTSGPTTDDAMTRSEERLNVGTQSTEVGRARLRKHVVTENVSRTVPVSREEVRVEREPITDANIGNALDGPALSEEEHEVTLHAERPVVEKETVPVERVRLDKQTVTDQETVNAQVGREEIEQVDVDADRTGRNDR